MGKKKAINVVPAPNEADSIDITKKWLSAKQLKELGIQHKTGKFTDEEKASLKAAVDSYLVRHSLDAHDLQLLLYKRRNRIVESNADNQIRGSHKEFLPEVAGALPERPLEATYRCLQRMYEDTNHKGAWTAEEDEQLRKLHEKYKGCWLEISQRLGRTLTNCHHRWGIVQRRQTMSRGKFTSEELEKFRLGCIDLLEAGKEPSTEFWEAVAQKVETRDATQCREKWVRTMERLNILGLDPLDVPRPYRTDARKQWTPTDTKTLIKRLKALEVSSDSDIDWTNVSVPEWVWAPAVLAQKWNLIKLRAQLEIGKDVSMRKLLKWAKKRLEEVGAPEGAQPLPPVSPKSMKKFLSEEFVYDSDVESDEESIGTDNMEPLDDAEPIQETKTSKKSTKHKKPADGSDNSQEVARKEAVSQAKEGGQPKKSKQRKSSDDSEHAPKGAERHESKQSKKDEPESDKDAMEVDAPQESKKRTADEMDTEEAKPVQPVKTSLPPTRKQIIAEKRRARKALKRAAKQESRGKKKGAKKTTPSKKPPANKQKYNVKPKAAKAEGKAARRLARLERRKARRPIKAENAAPASSAT